MTGNPHLTRRWPRTKVPSRSRGEWRLRQTPFPSPDGLTGRYDDQFDVAAFRLPFHFFHNWQTTIRSGADHEPVAFPGYLHSVDNGVYPNSSRNLLEGAFLRLRISPQSITTSCSYVLPSIRRAPKENLSKCIRASPCCVQALFFEVTAEKADQRCSTS